MTEQKPEDRGETAQWEKEKIAQRQRIEKKDETEEWEQEKASSKSNEGKNK